MAIKLVDSIDHISSKINKACSEEINKIFLRKRYLIASSCKRLAAGWILEQPEMESLAGGALAGLFGLYSGTESSIVNRISEVVSESVDVRVEKITPTLKGGIIINFQPSTFINLLSLPEGHVVYENGDLHWLDWLITRGDSAIVVNYSYSPKYGLGRSGRGIMKNGGFFRVPPQFSGTLGNNFVTRALVGRDQEGQINKEIKRILS